MSGYERGKNSSQSAPPVNEKQPPQCARRAQAAQYTLAGPLRARRARHLPPSAALETPGWPDDDGRDGRPVFRSRAPAAEFRETVQFFASLRSGLQCDALLAPLPVRETTASTVPHCIRLRSWQRSVYFADPCAYRGDRFA